MFIDATQLSYFFRRLALVPVYPYLQEKSPGPLVNDAYLAASALDHGCELRGQRHSAAYGQVMKLPALNHPTTSPKTLAKGPKLHQPATKHGFEPGGTPPEPTPVWKKLVNTAVNSAGGAALGTVVATAVIAAAAHGPDALGAPVLGVMIGGPVGLATGAVAGWKNCGVENPSVGRKLLNAVCWAAVGAGVGAVGSVALAAMGMQGPDALAAFLFAPAGAAIGAAAAGVVGWKMTNG
ncbi:MAG: hypothetical protein KF760_35190 [Candidatus Eremiobacteraeota bacterium]|nr:hypothetical protein [Candidatus Eremiobacteraeota bacterium]MCW5870211.1 hypothetical protein [Candidatus Eremiobacteraeota bacterium]